MMTQWLITYCKNFYSDNFFSFENSNCDDYVTEKFFKVLNRCVVPVVLGGANYSEIAPERSYIDAGRFKSPEALAKYMQYLDQNDTAYAEYFEWKPYFNITLYSAVFCQICEALNDPHRPAKTYPDLEQLWLKDSHCKRKGTLPWSNYANNRSKPDWNFECDRIEIMTQAIIIFLYL